MVETFEKFHKKEVISKFKKKFKVIGVNGFKEMDYYGKKLNLDYIYVQKGGQKDRNVSNKIKTLIHYLYPHLLPEYYLFYIKFEFFERLLNL